MTRNFIEMLRARMAEGFSLCTGLDSDVTKIPERFHHFGDNMVYEFNKEAIRASSHLAVAAKFQIASYRDEHGGRRALRRSIEFLKEYAPQVPVILDAKRGDIDNSNLGYLVEVFDWFGADAVTVNPYLGYEGALEVFINHNPDKGVIVLCKTSNPGAAQLQNRLVVLTQQERDDQLATQGVPGVEFAPLYRVVARHAARDWNDHGNVCVVVGATFPQEMADIRRIVGDMPILAPGYGAQGAKTEATIVAGLDSDGMGLINNVSRALIFPEDGDIATAAQAWHNEFTRCAEVAMTSR